MHAQLLINIIVLAAMYSLLAKSFEIIYQTISLFLLTHALAITAGVYFLYYLYNICAFPMWISFGLALFVIVMFSFVLYFVIYKPLRERKSKSWEIMIASLGVYVVSINSISILFGDQILSLDFAEITWSFCNDKFFISNVQLISLLISISLLVLTYLICEKSRIGLEIKSSSINSDLSVTYGIDNRTITLWCLAIGNGLAFFAGFIIALDVSIWLSIGFEWLFPGIVAMVIGGVGKTRYLVLGALLLATAQHLSAYFFDSKWMNATAYIILVVFLYFRPYGFSGKKIKKTEV